jgi:1-acyl-sn-glycerol-3-phosphate acyltransferase
VATASACASRSRPAGAAQPLLIFPEGTTTDGRSLRTFHGRLLAGAIDHGTPLQPVAIQYLRGGSLTRLPPSSATTTWSRT